MLTKLLFHPVKNRVIQPETRAAAGYEPQMSAMLHGNQTQQWISRKRRMVVDPKRDHRIVLGRDQQCRNTNSFQVLVPGLRTEVILRGSEPEKLRCVVVIEIHDAFHARQMLQAIDVRSEGILTTNSLFKPRDEPVLIDKVARNSDGVGAGAQVYRSGYGGYPRQ